MAGNLVMADLQLIEKCQSTKINEKRLHIKFPKFFAPDRIDPVDREFYNREVARYVLHSKCNLIKFREQRE